MSVMVKDSLGRWVQAAGQGKAEYGASTVRTGTVTLTASSTIGGAAVKNVTFNSPMPDATYEVTLTLGGEGNDSTATVVYNTKTANGFTIRLTTLHSAASGKSVTIGYTAFKLYTDTEYNQVLDVTNNIGKYINKSLTVSVTSGNTEYYSEYYTVPKGTYLCIVKHELNSGTQYYVDYSVEGEAAVSPLRRGVHAYGQNGGFASSTCLLVSDGTKRIRCMCFAYTSGSLSITNLNSIGLVRLA